MKGIALKGHKRSQLEDTLKAGTKKDAVIHLKLQNPSVSLKQISMNVHCNYDYARRVWSKFVKKQVTIRGSPFPPFDVHGWFKWTQVNPIIYESCPIEPSENRNRQKSWRGKRSSLVFHKKGSIHLYPYYADWEDEVRQFLLSFVPDGLPHVEAVMQSFKDHGRKEIAFHTPRVQKNYRIRIKGVGTFQTDATPYPDGTTEYVADLGHEKRLDRIEKAMLGFAKGMDQHMAMVNEIRILVHSLQKVVEAMK